MSELNNSNLIARRAAYYGNSLTKLQQLIIDLKNDQANKWYNESDDKAVSMILQNLTRAEIYITRRFGEVLGERADDLLHRLEAGDD